MNQTFKTWLVQEGIMDTIGNMIGSAKKFSDADILNTARAFYRYVKNKGIEWDTSDKQIRQNITNVVKGFMLGHDNIKKNPKDLNLGLVADALVGLTHNINQANSQPLKPEDVGKLYIDANQDDPKQFPLQPGSTNPAIFNWDRINRAFVRTKPETKPGSPMQHIAEPEEFKTLSPAIQNFKRQSGFTSANANDDLLIGKLFKILSTGTNGPWQSMLKTLYFSYRSKVSPSESAVDFISNLTHNYNIPNFQAVHDYAEQLDKELAKVVPLPPQPGPTPTNSKDKKLEIWFASNFVPKWELIKSTPAAATMDPATIRKMRGERVTLSDWLTASPRGRAEASAWVAKNLRIKSIRTEFIDLTT